MCAGGRKARAAGLCSPMSAHLRERKFFRPAACHHRYRLMRVHYRSPAPAVRAAGFGGSCRWERDCRATHFDRMLPAPEVIAVAPTAANIADVQRSKSPLRNPPSVHRTERGPQRPEGGAPNRIDRRKCLGVMPVSALKKRLNGPIEPKPQSSAMVRIGKWSKAGSASFRFASSKR